MLFGSRFLFLNTVVKFIRGFSGGSVVKESACRRSRRRRCGFDSWVGEIPWRRKWQPTPVILPGKSYGQRKLAGYSPWDRKKVGPNLATTQQQKFTRCKMTHFNHSKRYNSILRSFTMLFNHYWYLFSRNFDHPKGNRASIKQSLPISLPLPPRTNCFLSGDLPILDILYPRNQTICGLLYLTSFTYYDVFKVHLCCST